MVEGTIDIIGDCGFLAENQVDVLLREWFSDSQTGIDFTHAEMEDAAEGVVLHVVGQFFLGVELRHFLEIELERTVDVGVDGGRREIAIAGRLEGGWTTAIFSPDEMSSKLLHHLFALWNDNAGRKIWDIGCREVLQFDFVCQLQILLLHQHLFHEARHLSTRCAFGGIVVDECHVLCSLNEAIEIVGIEAVALVTRGEMILFAEEIWDERTAGFRLRQVAFVHTEHEHILEVEIARFEHSHQLNAHSGFAVERQGMGIDDLEKQTSEK